MAKRLLPAQIRAARVMLDWSMVDLARTAGVSVLAVHRLEAMSSQPLSDEISATVQAALEAAGVRFLSDEGEGVGLRLQTT